MWERYGETRGKDMGKAIPVFYWKTVGWGVPAIGMPQFSSISRWDFP